MEPKLVTSQAYILRAGKPPAAVSFRPYLFVSLFASWDSPTKPLPDTVFKLASLPCDHETLVLLFNRRFEF